MSVELNQYIVRSFYAAIDRDGMHAADLFLADDFSARVVGFPEVMDCLAYQKFGQDFYQSLSGLQHTIEEMVAEGEWVMMRITVRGRHLRDFYGIRPTGNPVSVAMSVSLRIKNSKIVEARELIDQFGMLQQMGVFPKAEDVLVRPVAPPLDGSTVVEMIFSKGHRPTARTP